MHSLNYIIQINFLDRSEWLSGEPEYMKNKSPGTPMDPKEQGHEY